LKRRDAFTLTELLVLVPIVAMLGALLLASLGDAKQTLQAAQCLSNMRQWGLAMGMYCNDYHDYIPYEGTGCGSDISTVFNLVAWFNVLPHYMNQTPLKDLYTSSPPNIPLPGQRSIYVCPSVTPGSQDGFGTSANNPWFGYAMDRLNNGASGHLYPRSLSALPGQVIFLSESENNCFPFTDGFIIGANGSNPPVPPRHSGGMNFVFVDGHAQWYALSDYGRPSSMSSPVGAQIEWASPKALYWFPCRTCNKN
jgi:prepilin-type processing-associated H-X9-DG protein